jgi:ribosome-associated heat shock protein Hsp15
VSRKERSAQAGKETASGRLDRWLYFARLVKSRSMAARLCFCGAVALNGVTVRKPGHRVRPGDEIVLKRGAYRLSLRVLDLGVRRGPSAEARALYEERAAPTRLFEEAA